MRLAQLKQVQDAHEDGVWAAAWAPATDSRPALLLTGSVDETVKLWSGDDLQPAGINSGHALGVVAVAVDPAGTTAASSSMDSMVRVFDVDTNATKAALECAPAESWALAFDPQGKHLAVAGGGSASVKLWSTDTWQLEGSLEVPSGGGASSEAEAGSAAGAASKADKGGGKFVLAVAWSADGRRLACSTMDGTVAVFDVARQRLLHTLGGHHMPVRSLCFSPVDARLLFTASDDMHVHLYDAEGGTLIAALAGHGGWVVSLAVSPDGAALATGSSDRSVRLWDLATRAVAQTVKDHSDQVWSVAFRPPGGDGVRAGRLATVSDDKSIALYDYT
eukprot:jgi/Mesen1/5044/ME000025S04446